MRQKLLESVEIPQGVSCEVSNKILKCAKGGKEVSLKVNVPEMSIFIKENKIFLECIRGNKGKRNIMMSYLAHIKKTFFGLDNDYIYKLESCNVHFPMTLKVEGDKLTINNFLGEKTPRLARILSGVKVEVKGAKITITSSDKDAAGQTAANFERATKIRNRDRRIFQDGIFITDRPGGVK